MTLRDRFYYLNPYVLRNTIRYHYLGWRAEREIRPGDIYEDCNYHPVICTENDRGDLWGISMVDGTGPRGCSMFHCGPVKMDPKTAVEQATKIRNGEFEYPTEVEWSSL
jgi:hypothetical protein